jgi:3'-5' exoribonuclease
MKEFLKDLQPDQVHTTAFLVQQKEIRQKKSGEPYLSLILSDRSGEVDAKMWDNVPEVIGTFDRDDFVKVKGLIQVYHNRLQLTVHKIRKMAEHEVDFTDYFPASERDPAEMWQELRGLVAGLMDPHLRGLLDALLDDPEIARRMRLAPAAKHIHHAYLGGLLEHVLSLCQLSKAVAAHYPGTDLNLLLTGAVLHDLGKIYELSYDRGFGYTPEGQLLGHMAIALRLVSEKLALLPQFPPKLRILVEHMILSHHGHLEFGSPKVPQFPEALLLHYIDDLDSKMAAMRWLAARDRQVEGVFTSYSTSLERVVLKKAKYLDAEAPAPEASAPPPAAAPQAQPAPAPPPKTETAAADSAFARKLSHALTGPGRDG